MPPSSSPSSSPSSIRVPLLLSAFYLTGCFQSTFPGGVAPIDPTLQPPSRPDVLGFSENGVRQSFELFGVEGRCVADVWRLDIDENGNAQSIVDGVTDSSGNARGDDVSVVASFGGATLELYRASEEWSGFPLWHVYQDGVLLAWAVELSRPVGVPEVPAFRACATFEQWSVHEREGSTSHAEAVVDIEGASWRGDEDEFPLWIDVESDGRVRIQDARLPLRDDGIASGAIEGEMIAWDGVEGVVRVRNSIGLCSVAEGVFTVRLVRDEVHVVQSWYVVDVLDRDLDGDREEQHLRRTRTVLTRGACPLGFSR